MNDHVDSELRRHILSVVLEDYCHVAPVSRVVPPGYWHRFESRVQTHLGQSDTSKNLVA